MDTLQDQKITAHHTLQDIIKLKVPEAAMHQLTSSLMWSHGEADVNKKEVDVLQQCAAVMQRETKQRMNKSGWENVWRDWLSLLQLELEGIFLTIKRSMLANVSLNS